MTESTSATALSDGAGMPYYEKQRTQLHNLINKKKILERNLANLEENILKKEMEYLEDTPHGNIITGFEGYTKGTTAVLGQRRRGTMVESNKVFSRSSVTFNANAEAPAETAASTPAAAMAPTPLSTAFVKGEGGGSNGATPTSTSSKSGAGKKHKKAQNGDDSDTDARESKKVRTNFGVTRK